MAQTSDPSPKTLPRQELNPLLNPLLAENMNRWAEVYFNNPPERREQAVLALLRELETQHALREAATAASRATFHDTPVAKFSIAARPSIASPTAGDGLLRCERCGRDNPVTHKFCGMCGEILHAKREATRQSATPREYAPAYSNSAYPNEDKPEDAVAEATTEADLEPNPASRSFEPAQQSPVASMSELSLFQSAPREYESNDDEDDPYRSTPSRSYRVYLGGILAIVLLALGYTAWRASHNSQTSDEPSPVPPVAAREAPATTPPATIPATDASHSAAPALAAEKPAPKSARLEETRGTSNVADADDSAKAGSSAPKQSSTLGGGNEELAQAERYLDATNGHARDSAAATPWLWKSIAKHNRRATLLLADLYLKGDGVSKNCDQARILLDSAARNGVEGAGERLRNLPAFGCQ